MAAILVAYKIKGCDGTAVKKLQGRNCVREAAF